MQGSILRYRPWRRRRDFDATQTMPLRSPPAVPPTGTIYAFIGCDDASAVATIDLSGYP